MEVKFLEQNEGLEQNERRWQMMVTTAEAVAYGFPANQNRFECVRNPVPPDAKVVRAGYDPNYDQFYCVIEHPSFPQLPEGVCIPLMEPALFTLHTPPPGKEMSQLATAFAEGEAV